MIKKTILVVDDEEDIRTTIKTILEKAGFRVITAVNPEDCLKKLKSGEKPDLILMDIMMPGTPVKEVVPLIKDIKIVYLSVVSVSNDQKKELAKQKNVVGYLQKPFDIDYLIKNVKKFVDK